jgi:hypothetical protein
MPHPHQKTFLLMHHPLHLFFLHTFYSIVCNASVALLPGTLSPANTTLDHFATADLFERVPVQQPPPSTLRIAFADVITECQLVYSGPNEPSLILVRFEQAHYAHCISIVNLLESIDLAGGLHPQSIVGVYGEDENLYDVSGPLEYMQGSFKDRWTRTPGIAVQPAFIDRVRDAMGDKNATLYAYLQPEPGVYNLLVTSQGFVAFKVVAYVAMGVAFLYGSSYVFWSLLVVAKLWLWGDRVVKPNKWVSPLDVAYWRPHVSGIIRISSLACLLLWDVGWRYKLTTKTAVLYHLSLLSAILGFALMVYRWCTIVEQIRSHRIYRLLRIWCVVEIIIGGIASVCSTLEPISSHSPMFYQFNDRWNNFVLEPSLLLFAFTFCVSSFLFLKAMKRMAMRHEVHASLRKITYFGLSGLALITLYLSSTIINIVELGDDYTRYVAFLVLETALWVVYHTSIFYLLALPIPKTSSVQEPVTSASWQQESSTANDTTDQYELAHTQLTHRLSEAIEGRSKWNEIVLQSAPKSTARERGPIAPTSPVMINRLSKRRSSDSFIVSSYVVQCSLSDLPNDPVESFQESQQSQDWFTSDFGK